MGAVIAAVVGISSLLVGPIVTTPAADMHIEPTEGMVILSDTFLVSIVVEASEPTNVFSGRVEFNNQVLAVESIDYNTSLADLWAIEPWYENGAGTVTFAGGTTRAGGFTGQDTLITITFQSISEGEGILSLKEARILRHDGLGTDVGLAAPIDSIFTVAPEVLENETVSYDQQKKSKVVVRKELPDTDLNQDGKQSLADISIFMAHLAGQNLRSDFNGDGSVSVKDLSILLKK